MECTQIHVVQTDESIHESYKFKFNINSYAIGSSTGPITVPFSVNVRLIHLPFFSHRIFIDYFLLNFYTAILSRQCNFIRGFCVYWNIDYRLHFVRRLTNNKQVCYNFNCGCMGFSTPSYDPSSCRRTEYSDVITTEMREMPNKSIIFVLI